MGYLIGKLAHTRKRECSVAETETALTKSSRIPEEVPECVCVSLEESLREDVQVQGAIEIRQKLLGEIKAGKVEPSTLYRARAAWALMPEEVRESAFKNLCTEAESLCDTRIDELKRKFVKKALLDGVGQYELSRTGEALLKAFRRAWSDLEIQSHEVMGPKDAQAWLEIWEKEGDAQAARTQVLAEPHSWATGKEHWKQDMLRNALITHGAWAAQSNLLETATRALMRELQDSEDEIVLIDDWTRMSGTSGNDSYWRIACTYEGVERESILAIKVPRWVAFTLEELLAPIKVPFAERVKVLRLRGPQDRWKEDVEMMLVLWKDAGGTFEFEKDSYGTRRYPEGMANHEEAWRAAKAL